MARSGRDDWVEYVDPDGRFRLRLPPRAAPKSDPTVSDSETYLYWSPRPRVGTFSVHIEPGPGERPEDMLTREREGGARVVVEADEPMTEGTWPGRRLRYRASRRRPRTTRRDPRTRTIEHDEGGDEEWLCVFTFWHGSRSVAQVGFRVLVSAEPEIHDTLEEIAGSFELLRLD
jgi:hypothetical protein